MAVTIPLEVQIKCVERECKLRENLYKKRVGDGSMKREIAVAELTSMRQVLQTLRMLQSGELATFIKKLEELPNDIASLQNIIFDQMTEASRIIGEKQELEKEKRKLLAFLQRKNMVSDDLIKEVYDVDPLLLKEENKLEDKHGNEIHQKD